jgi:hypothetical protein
MGSDLRLLIFEPGRGVVVRARWLGMRGTLERLHEVLARPATTSGQGWDCWTDLSTKEVLRIAEASYADGASPAEIDELARTFPTPPHWWMILRDY